MVSDWVWAWHRYQLRQLSEVLGSSCGKELIARTIRPRTLQFNAVSPMDDKRVKQRQRVFKSAKIKSAAAALLIARSATFPRVVPVYGLRVHSGSPNSSSLFSMTRP